MLKAEKDWDILYCDASKFLAGAEFYAGNGDLRHSVFMLHQATERVWSAMIRVFAGLHTSTHNLNKLLRYTPLFRMEPSAVFPRNTPEAMHLFDLLFKVDRKSTRLNSSHYCAARLPSSPRQKKELGQAQH